MSELSDTDRLIASALNGNISAEDNAQFEQLLETDAEVRDAYLFAAEIDTDLRFVISRRHATKQTSDTTPSQNAEPTAVLAASRKQSPLQWASRHPKGPAFAVAATVLIAALVVMGLTPVKDWIAKTSKSDADSPTTGEYVAILNNSHNAKWLDDTRPRLKDPRLQIGRRLAIDSGLIEVKYYTGATVVIEGPAEFVVGGNAVGNAVPGVPERQGRRSLQENAANSGYLQLGKLVARVEGKDAQGFTIDTPMGRVEDLGTEFGVEVLQGGAAEFLVLSGKVDVICANADGSEQRMRLVKDQGAFVTARGEPIVRRDNVDFRIVAAMRSRLESIREQPATDASKLVNGDFSSAFDDDGPDVVDLQANTGEWLSDVSSVADWVVNSGAADLGGEGGLGKTRSLVQAVQDSKATKGGATIDFLIDIDGLSGNANEDLNLYVLGWNRGDTSPTVDLSQGDGRVGTSVVLNDAINLFDGTATLSPFQIVENGAITTAAAAGINQTDGFDAVSLDIDFGAAGYDFFAVVFEGEPRDDTLSSYRIDKVSIREISTSDPTQSQTQDERRVSDKP